MKGIGRQTVFLQRDAFRLSAIIVVMKENKINKTNSSPAVDKAKIAYELIPYEVDEKDLSAIHVLQFGRGYRAGI